MCELQLHHVSIMADDYDWYVSFFRDVFGMEVEKTKGEAPKRNIWFKEGIQLRECVQLPPASGVYDHFAFGSDDIPGTVAKALAAGCQPLSPEKPHWFVLPNGAGVEMKPKK